MNFLTSPKISEHIFAEHLVLLNHTTNQLLVLNPSARLVWQWLSQGYDKAQIITQLAKFFKIPRSIAKQDVKKLLSNWYQHKLLVRSIEAEKPFMSKEDNDVAIANQSINMRKVYLLANIPFSLSFNDEDMLANHIHSLFAHIEVYNQQPLKNFTLVKTTKKHILLTDDEKLFSDFANVKGYLITEILKLSYPNVELSK